MTIFLVLAPYGVFAFLMLATSATVSLFAAAATCLVAIAIDVAARPLGQDSWRRLGDPVRRARPLSAGWHPVWSTSAVNLAVDTGIS